MYLDSVFKVKKVEHHPEFGRTVHLRKWPRGRGVYRLYSSNLDVDENDIIHAQIQNHDPEHGWEMDNMHGFHYDNEKPSCDVCR